MAILLISVVGVTVATGVPVRSFTRDPLAIANGHPLWGMVSNVGVLIWCAGASICLFAAAVLYAQRAESHHIWFLFAAGILTSILLVDDLFMLHDRIAPAYLGMDEKQIFAIEALASGVFLLLCRRVILASNPLLLLLALTFFAMSLAVDTLPETWSEWHHLFEDGSKLFGIVSWSGYFVLTAQRMLSESGAPKEGSPGERAVVGG